MTETETQSMTVTIHKADELTDVEKELIEFDRKYEQDIKPFFEAYEAKLAEAQEKLGLNHMWQSPEKLVYGLTEPKGTFVAYKKLKLMRTRRTGEKGGDFISKEKAIDAGFEI